MIVKMYSLCTACFKISAEIVLFAICYYLTSVLHFVVLLQAKDVNTTLSSFVMAFLCTHFFQDIQKLATLSL
jgi:hypothetical protein